MEKIKIKIGNLTSDKSSKHLERLIGNIKGVSIARINYESGKTVIIFDNSLIDGKSIFKTILKGNNYTINEYNQAGSEKKIEENKQMDNEHFFNKDMLLGFLVAVVSFSVIINIVLLNIIFK